VHQVECHGTGTSLGDPIELGSLRSVLTSCRPGIAEAVSLGAIKTNQGHLEGAAGISGLSKSILLRVSWVVPPNIHQMILNPHLDISGFPVHIHTEACGDHTSQGLTGVSSFGFGGTNAHSICASETDEQPQKQTM
jgi:acyl transferase domain-containing protein